MVAPNFLISMRARSCYLEMCGMESSKDCVPKKGANVTFAILSKGDFLLMSFGNTMMGHIFKDLLEYIICVISVTRLSTLGFGVTLLMEKQNSKRKVWIGKI